MRHPQAGQSGRRNPVTLSHYRSPTAAPPRTQVQAQQISFMSVPCWMTIKASSSTESRSLHHSPSNLTPHATPRTRVQAQLLVVIQHGVEVLNPDGVHGAVKHQPLAVGRGVARGVAEQHRQHAVRPLLGHHVLLQPDRSSRTMGGVRERVWERGRAPPAAIRPSPRHHVLLQPGAASRGQARRAGRIKEVGERVGVREGDHHEHAISAPLGRHGARPLVGAAAPPQN